MKPSNIHESLRVFVANWFRFVRVEYMRSKIIEQLREEERASFLKLDPVDRILRMEKLLYEMISIKADEEGVAESEVYNRYLGHDQKRRRTI